MSYCIRALKNMPGRKALIALTPQTSLPGLYATATGSAPDYQALYARAYNQLADAALRAGVVVHLLDIRGLEAPFPGPVSAAVPLLHSWIGESSTS